MSERQPDLSVTKDDLVFSVFHAGGPGGQNQNKISSGVRCYHPASGVTVESRSLRSQLGNKRECLKKLAGHQKFKAWVKLQLARKVDVDAKVNSLMASENIRVDIIDANGRWKPEQEEA